jgi:hypothetical protein
MNNGGGFGGGNWMWIIFLFFLYGCEVMVCLVAEVLLVV